MKLFSVLLLTLLVGCSSHQEWHFLGTEFISTSDGIILFLDRPTVLEKPYFLAGEQGGETISREVTAMKISIDPSKKIGFEKLLTQRCKEVEPCEAYPRKYIIGRESSENTLKLFPSALPEKDRTPLNVLYYSGLRKTEIRSSDCISVFNSDQIDLNTFRDWPAENILKIAPVRKTMVDVYALNCGDPLVSTNIVKTHQVGKNLQEFLKSDTELQKYFLTLLDIGRDSDENVVAMFGVQNSSISIDYISFVLYSAVDNSFRDVSSILIKDPEKLNADTPRFIDVDRKLVVSDINYRDGGVNLNFDMLISDLSNGRSVRRSLSVRKSELQ